MSLPSLHLLHIDTGPPGPCARTDGPQSAAARQTDIPYLPRDLWAHIFNDIRLYLGAPDNRPAEVLRRYDHMCRRVHKDDPSSEALYITLPIIREVRDATRAEVDEAYCRAALVAIFDAYKWTAFLEKDRPTGLMIVREQRPLPTELKDLRYLASLHLHLYADEKGDVDAVLWHVSRVRLVWERCVRAFFGNVGNEMYDGANGYLQWLCNGANGYLQWLIGLLPHLRFGHTQRIGPVFKDWIRTLLKTHAADANVGAWSPQRLVDGSAMFGAEPNSTIGIDHSSNFVGVGIGEWTLRELVRGDRMFAECRRFAPADISQWNLGKLENGERMFNGCHAFDPTGMESLDFSNLQNAEGMFAHCSSLSPKTNLPWNFTKLNNGKDMFAECRRFAPTDISQWNLGKLEDGHGMFSFCHAFNPMGMESLDFSKLANAEGMFAQCVSLSPTGRLPWKFTELKNGKEMFDLCARFAPSDISQWDLGKLENGHGMFSFCHAFNPTGMESLDFSKLKDASRMFYKCKSLSPTKVLRWTFTELVQAREMFGGCTNLGAVCLTGLAFPKLQYAFAKGMFAQISYVRRERSDLQRQGEELKTITFSETFFHEAYSRERVEQRYQEDIMRLDAEPVGAAMPEIEIVVNDVRAHIFGKDIDDEHRTVYSEVVRHWLSR